MYIYILLLEEHLRIYRYRYSYLMHIAIVEVPLGSQFVECIPVRTDQIPERRGCKGNNPMIGDVMAY